MKELNIILKVLFLLVIGFIKALFLLLKGDSAEDKKQITEDRSLNKKNHAKNINLSILTEIFETKSSLERQRELANKDMNLHEVIRNLQIISDSRRICLSSKKLDTAVYRRDLMNERLALIEEKRLLNTENLSYVRKIVNETNEKFFTLVYLNVAKGFEEKSYKMKSDAGQLKYLNQALDALQEGLENEKSDKDKIQFKILQITTLMNGLRKRAS